MKTNLLLLTAVTFCLAAAPVFGDTLIFTGDTTGANVFNRPTEPGDALSDIGSAVPYFAEGFTVSLDGSYNFSALANDPTSFDTFVHLYSGTFNPASPLDNLVRANDDAVNNNPDFGSAINGQALTAGISYIFVINGFGNSDYGSFSASISGPGTVSPVPEPSTAALAGLAAAGLWLRWRRGGRQ